MGLDQASFTNLFLMAIDDGVLVDTPPAYSAMAENEKMLEMCKEHRSLPAGFGEVLDAGKEIFLGSNLEPVDESETFTAKHGLKDYVCGRIDEARGVQ